MKPSPSSSEGRLTSLGLDLPLNQHYQSQGVPLKGGTLSRDSSSTVPRVQGQAEPPSGPSMETLLAHLGNPGRFQIVVMILLATNVIPVVVNHLLMAFYSIPAPHNCRVPPDFAGNKSQLLPLRSEPLSPILARRFKGQGHGEGHSEGHGEGHEIYADCDMYVSAENHSLGVQPCVHGYEFHLEDREWSIVAEWGLVCDRAFVAPLVTTVYFCGVTLGGVLFGSLSDRYGRKNLMLTCLYTQCLIGIALHFVRRLVVFIGLRFVQGIFIQGLQCITYSMVMELVTPGYRTLAGCVIEAFWATGVILLAAIAKYVQHWRYIQLAVNIPTLSTVFYIWIIPESVRWLLSKGKLKRAEEIVVKIASYNSIRLDRAWLREELEGVAGSLRSQDQRDHEGDQMGGPLNSRQEDQERNPGLRDVVCNPWIRRRALALFFIWFSVSLSYYGISFSIPNLSGDLYLNFMIGGGIELAAYILAFVVLQNFGRKYPLAIYLFLSGALCIGAVVVEKYLQTPWVDAAKLSLVLALLGKAAVVSCFCSIFIYSTEIFPTVIRTVGVGSCVFFGRIGSLLAPQILLLGKHFYKSSPELLTFLTFGGISLLASLLMLGLPETLNRDLPDTVRQANRQGPQRKKSPDKKRRRKFGGRRRSGGPGDDDDEAMMQEAGYGKSPEWVEVT